MPKMSTDSLPEKDKLTRFNYEIWSMKMEGLLVIRNLWDPVEGVALPSTAFEDDKKRYTAKDRQARFLIIAAIDNSFYRAVKPLKTSKQVWDHLAKLFENKTHSRKAKLAGALSSLKKSDSESISEYFERASAIHQDLANVKCEIPEDFLSAVVLNGLPAEYDVSVEVLRSKHETLTLSQALEPMMNTEQNIENRSGNP